MLFFSAFPLVQDCKYTCLGRTYYHTYKNEILNGSNDLSKSLVKCDNGSQSIQYLKSTLYDNNINESILIYVCNNYTFDGGINGKCRYNLDNR